MTLAAWTKVGSATPTEDLDAYEYKIFMETRGSFSVLNPNNSGWTVTYLVGWGSAFDEEAPDISGNNLLNFVSDVLGYSFVTGTGPYTLNRILPEPHKDIPIMYAIDAKVEPLGACDDSANGGIEYPTAKVIVEFKPLDFAIKADSDIDDELDRYCTRNFGVEAQYLTLQGKMRWATPANSQLDTNPGKITSTLNYDVTWHQVPALPTAPYMIPNLTAINNCIGRVNSEVVDPNNLNAQPGTLLFLGLDPKMQLPCLGGTDAIANGITFQNYWEIPMKFLYRYNGIYNLSSRIAGAGLIGQPIGHNFVYRTGPASGPGGALPCPFWDYVSADGTYPGVPIYPSADLNQLFTITG